MLAGMIEKEISEEVEKMLECLKPLDRELFMKLYVEDKTIEQVSEETGMKKGKNSCSHQSRKCSARFSEVRRQSIPPVSGAD